MSHAKYRKIKMAFVQVEEDSGNERVVEPQRTLPVHARCQVIRLKINQNYAYDVIDNYDYDDDGNFDYNQ